MASGGIRFDFTVKQHHITYGEDRTLRLPAVDENGADITSFTGWEVDFFWIARLDIANGVAALAAEGVALLIKTEAVIDIATPPNIDVPLLVADWASIGTEPLLAYECWRTNTGNTRRLAHGTIEVAS